MDKKNAQMQKKACGPHIVGCISYTISTFDMNV